MKPAQINFVKECLPAAVSAGAAFNLNPLVILAQAAFESGWERAIWQRSAETISD